jgi:hypothetical protein
MFQEISRADHESGANLIVYRNLTLGDRYGIHTKNPIALGGSSCFDFLDSADLRRIYNEIGTYLDSLSLERYKTNYCLQPNYKHMTIYQYASDVIGSRYKANNWLLRQSDLTLEEVENKLGQIEYGVYS